MKIINSKLLSTILSDDTNSKWQNIILNDDKEISKQNSKFR